MRSSNVRVGVLAAAVMAAFAAPAQAQQFEAAGILKKAAATVGANDMNTLIYSAAGNAWGPGQPYTAGKALPKQIYTIRRSIDFNNNAVSDDVTRSRAEPRGGTAVPLEGQQVITEALGNNASWNVVNKQVVASNRWVGERIPNVWMNPVGIVKAALKNNATLSWTTEGKKSLGVVSFSEPGRYTAKVFINDAYEVERIEALVPNPVLGDMPLVTRFSEYREFGRSKYPTRIEESQNGQPTLQLVVTDVQPNGKVAIEVPAAATSYKETVTSQKLADGVYFLAGGSHNSVAVEMKDHVVVVEAPLSDVRSEPVIAETRKLIPNKPIRYVMNTHVHFDHSGGLGGFAAEGITILTHQNNKAYFDRAFAAKRTISPDNFAKSKKKANVRGVGDKFVHTDGDRSIEMHVIKGNQHNDSLYMVYLPKEKVLIQADVFGPLPPGAKPPAKPNPVLANFAQNIERLKLTPERIANIHGGVVPVAELNRALGK
jgi:glyoxylase-like metal-dependent hydrolase (beta-lactamase superfamily II)